LYWRYINTDRCPTGYLPCAEKEEEAPPQKPEPMEEEDKDKDDDDVWKSLKKVEDAPKGEKRKPSAYSKKDALMEKLKRLKEAKEELMARRAATVSYQL
jgi:hypothetical protein